MRAMAHFLLSCLIGGLLTAGLWGAIAFWSGNERAFQRTTASLENRPFVAVLLAGPNAIVKVRAMTGPTDPVKAPAGTIRGDFGCDTIALADAEDRATDNLIHAADSEASVVRESAIWFG